MTRLSLRARLLLGLVALTVIGLAVAAVVTYEEQRSFLLTRVDQQVGDSRIPVSVALDLIHPQGASTSSRQPTGGSAPGTFQTSGTYGIVVDSSGKVIETHSFTYGETPASPPALPHHLPISQFSSHDVHLFTVNSQAGSGLTYRAAAFTLKDGRTLVIAVPLNDVEQTLQRLTEVEALVTGGVILALVALGWVVIRVGLLPLERIGRVASEIAHGNLSQRVTPANDRTEVGRLGTSLNEMLAQIEHAFAQPKRGAPAPVPRRRVSRAPHLARFDPRIRRAVSPGCGKRAGRDRTRDEPNRSRGGKDGRPGREPVAAGSSRGNYRRRRRFKSI